MKAPVSVCLIVKNEELQLENCLRSIRDYVEEIVIVDTGSTDKTPEIAKKYADIFEVYTDCNDESGRIISFSAARERSFSLATRSWILWIDGDDQVIGGEHLYRVIEEANKAREGRPAYVMLPYHYAHDDKGNVTLLHYRERLICPVGAFKWINPVHEILNPLRPSETVGRQNDDIIIVHHRGDKQIECNRNLRILKELYEKEGEKDARHLYYLGLEYGNVGKIEESIKMLDRYLELSGWDDEKYMACLRLCEYYLSSGQYKKAIEKALYAISCKEAWCEAYFVLAKCYYFLAQGGEDPQKNWKKSVHFAQYGLSLPPTKTLLFVNPLERDFEIYKYLNVALANTGDIVGALNSCNIALSKYYESNLAYNKKMYEIMIHETAFKNSLNGLEENGKINSTVKNSLLNIYNNNHLDLWPTINKPANYPLGVTKEHFPRALPTSHLNAWGIPEDWDFDGLPLQLSDQQLQSVIIMLWKEYILHDEIMTAIKFLEDAPYRVKHSQATQKALYITKKMIAWMDDKDKSQKYNSTDTPLIECGVQLPKPLTGALLARYQWVSDRLRKYDDHLDMGCFDGAMTNRWGMEGYKFTGVDLCQTSIELANKKAEEFNTGAQHICTYFKDLDSLPNKYDTVTCCDTYEHVKDPVKDLLIPARSVLKSSGRILIVTPHGCWVRGEYLPWAHPWRWAQELNKPWICDEPRAHLTAPTVWTVADNLEKAGFWVKDCFVNLSDPIIRDVEGQGNVCLEAYVENPYPTKGHIVFYVGAGLETWTPETVKKTGIGGSELALIAMTKRFVKKGYKVSVYNQCSAVGEGIYDGVRYFSYEKFENITADVLIVSRQAQALSPDLNVKVKIKLLWVHDILALNASNKLLLEADRILALSEWHKNFLVQKHIIPPQQVVVTRNGLELERFEKNIVRNKYKVIYSSSPDRGLPVLLDMWPRIKEQVPEAELHIYYGFQNWETVTVNDTAQTNLILGLKNKIKMLSNSGVVYHGRINQEDLAKEFLSAGVWAYSTWFMETFCVTAAEAQAAGLRIITSPIAALNETVGDRGILIDGDWLSAEYQDKFIKATVEALLREDDSDRIELQKFAKEHFNWDGVADQWEQLIKDLEQEYNDNKFIHIPYQPIPGY